MSSCFVLYSWIAHQIIFSLFKFSLEGTSGWTRFRVVWSSLNSFTGEWLIFQFLRAFKLFFKVVLQFKRIRIRNSNFLGLIYNLNTNEILNQAARNMKGLLFLLSSKHKMRWIEQWPDSSLQRWKILALVKWTF